MYGLPANFPLTAPISAISGSPWSRLMPDPKAAPIANAPASSMPLQTTAMRPALIPGAMGNLSRFAQLLQQLRGIAPAGIQAFQGQPPGMPGNGLAAPQFSQGLGSYQPRKSSMYSLY